MKHSDGYTYYPPVNIYLSAKIGKMTSVGMFAEIGENVVIGERCRIGAFAFIPKGITIGNDVFIAPHVMFCNDDFPRAKNSFSGKWVCLETIVEDGASIGANSTILPGIRIGKYAMIGAGSVVTDDVEDCSVVYGSHAQKQRRL
jgi:UDP-2-acetamido-3-amino-2,3-dideoxy-glucuronate N-acetyltransferase